jgi:Flp pilus assembly protein TadB
MAKAHAAPRANSAAEPRRARPQTGLAPVRTAPRSTERRRREQHFRRRRRDLLTDAILALVLAIVLTSLTAGLGILLLVVVPMAAGLVAYRVVQHRLARRAPEPHRRPRSRASRPRTVRG